MKNKKGRRRCQNTEHVKTGPKPAPAPFVKMMLSEYYTEKQINSINIDSKADYGMDQEFMNICQRMESLYGFNKRELLPFEIIKFACLYLNIADIRAITGGLMLPDASPHYSEPKSAFCSKIERIRNEIFEAKNKLRPKPEMPVQHLLDYVLEQATKAHRFLELVSFDKDEDNKVVNMIGTFVDAVPKRDDNARKALTGEARFSVIVTTSDWPAFSYVITTDVYREWPNLKAFFESKIGAKFLVSFKEFLATRWPNMQPEILRQVNAFTNEYFKWMDTLISFTSHLVPEIQGNYTPMQLPSGITPDGLGNKRYIIRTFTRQYNGSRKGNYYVFIDDLRIAIEQLYKSGIPIRKPDALKLPREGTLPVVHRFAEILDPSVISTILKEISPDVDKVIKIVPCQMYSLTLTHGYFLPIVSPYNTHVIPSTDGFKRIMLVLVDEVQIGKKVPLTFQPFLMFLRKMEALFCGSNIYKTLVDRKRIHDLMKEAVEVGEQFTGKLKKPQGNFGQITAKSPEIEKFGAFLDSFKQFKPVMMRHLDDPVLPSNGLTVPPGEPSISQIFQLIYSGKEVHPSSNPSKQFFASVTKTPLSTISNVQQKISA